MTNPYNQLGTTYATVIGLFPGSVLADYGSQTIVDNALNRAVREVMVALSPESFRNISEPEFELVETRASLGQTTVTLGYNKIVAGSWPVIAGKTHIWVGAPLVFYSAPRYRTEFLTGYSPSSYQSFGNVSPACYELDSTQFSVDPVTGIVTLTTPLNDDDQVYATYKVDISLFSCPSLSEIAVMGAAAELGAMLYSQSSQEWKLVDSYKERYQNWLKLMIEGKWIPEELRYMRWWKEIERLDDASVTSLRLFRG